MHLTPTPMQRYRYQLTITQNDGPWLNLMKLQFGWSRVIFFTGSPQFQYQKENCQSQLLFQKILLLRNDWLLGNFLFGTKIGEGQLKKITLYMHMLKIFWLTSADPIKRTTFSSLTSLVDILILCCWEYSEWFFCGGFA